MSSVVGNTTGNNKAEDPLSPQRNQATRVYSMIVNADLYSLIYDDIYVDCYAIHFFCGFDIMILFGGV